MCAGLGGVGKTTVSASLGWLSASLGYKTYVLTIDPSYGLKKALGFKDNAYREPLKNLQTPSPLVVTALNPKKILDGFLDCHLKDEKIKLKMKNNQIYKELTTRLSFHQEFTSLVDVCEAASSGEFDKIILDTPPGPQFMSFLNASETLAPLFEKKLIRWLIQAQDEKGFLLRFFNKGPLLFLKLLQKFTGKAFLETLYEFMRGVNALKGPILSSLSRIESLLRSRDTSYIGVADLEGRLFDIERQYSAVVFNRMPPAPLFSESAQELCQKSLRKLEPPPSEALKAKLEKKQKYFYYKNSVCADVFSQKKALDF